MILRTAGLLHYQQNRDCGRTAKYTISYNSDDPQTVNQAIVSPTPSNRVIST